MGLSFFICWVAALTVTIAAGPPVSRTAAVYWIAVGLVGFAIDTCGKWAKRRSARNLCRAVCGLDVPWWGVATLAGTLIFGPHPLNFIYCVFVLDSLNNAARDRKLARG